MKQQLETKQQEERKSLGQGNPTFENNLWFNYRALQIYDLLSLYFCCDGYSNDDYFKQERLTPIGGLRQPSRKWNCASFATDVRSVRMEPYPFDIARLTVSARARIIPPEGMTQKQLASRIITKRYDNY